MMEQVQEMLVVLLVMVIMVFGGKLPMVLPEHMA